MAVIFIYSNKMIGKISTFQIKQHLKQKNINRIIY